MDTAPARTAHADAANALAADVRTSRRRRRPTGAPPPLPRTFPISSAGWLPATLALVAVFTITFAASRHSAALAITAADDRVVQWFAGLRSPWLTRVVRDAALAGSWGAIRVLVWGTFVSLLVLKRFRHLMVYFVVINTTFYLVAMLSAWLKRPRPFGVAILGAWNGYALPSIQITLLAASLVTVLYTLVPEGRWRQTGKWAAAAIVAIAAVARIYLGADAPTDVLLGAALGVTIPLLAFRFITPNSVFPIRYRRGRTAHLDVGGARGTAIRQALTDQLGLVVTQVKPFGLAGSAGSTPVRITVEGDPDTHLFGELYAKHHLRSDRSYKFGRELLYGRLEDEKPFNSVRRLVQQEDYALRLLHDAGLPSPRSYGVVELTLEREYLLVTESRRTSTSTF
jgi:membrane-associated phospholipid phosphatase